MVVFSVEAHTGRGIARRVDKVGPKADQAVSKGRGAAILLPQLPSSREMEAARSVHK